MEQEECVARLNAWVEDLRTGLPRKGVFEVAPERLPALRADLRDIAAATELALADARCLEGVEAPASDAVSVRSVNHLREAVEGGPGSLIGICEEIHTWVVGLCAEVDAALARHAVGACR